MVCVDAYNTVNGMSIVEKILTVDAIQDKMYANFQY